MLLDNFFNIIASTPIDNGMEYSIQLNAEHEIFKGHFPGNPVTPGVVQLQMVKELLAIQYQRPLQLETMGRCKYLKVLNPIQTPIITIQFTFTSTSTHQNPAIQASGSFDSDVFFKFNATYK